MRLARALATVLGAAFVLGAVALLLAHSAGCGGSWEQRAHRVVVGAAHLVAASDEASAAAYRARVAGLDGGAEFARIDRDFARVEAAQAALAALLVRVEAYLDDAAAHGGAPCRAAHALAGLAADLAFLTNALQAAGVDPPQDALWSAALLAQVLDEMLPRCPAADAGVEGGA